MTSDILLHELQFKKFYKGGEGKYFALLVKIFSLAVVFGIVDYPYSLVLQFQYVVY